MSEPQPDRREGGAPDLESEVLEIERRLQETRDRVIEELSKQLLDPSLSDMKRAQLEDHLRSFRKGKG